MICNIPQIPPQKKLMYFVNNVKIDFIDAKIESLVTKFTLFVIKLPKLYTSIKNHVSYIYIPTIVSTITIVLTLEF
jgi:hypothetical protein